MATKKRVKRQRQREELFYTWAFYADSGAGKTTLSATAPKPMFLDSNQGLLSVHGRPGFEDVRRTTIRGWRDLERAYDNFSGTGKKNWTGRKTAVFDHLDDIQGLVLDELTEQAAERDPRRIIDTTEQREWGIMLNRLRRLMRKFKALPMHKIMILSMGEDKITGRLEPSLSGKFREQLPYFCDMIGYLKIGKNGQRILDFRTREEFLGKARPWWWTDKDRRIIVPDVADEPQFLTNLFRRIAAGPEATTRRGNTRER